MRINQKGTVMMKKMIGIATSIVATAGMVTLLNGTGAAAATTPTASTAVATVKPVSPATGLTPTNIANQKAYQRLLEFERNQAAAKANPTTPVKQPVVGNGTAGTPTKDAQSGPASQSATSQVPAASQAASSAPVASNAAPTSGATSAAQSTTPTTATTASAAAEHAVIYGVPGNSDFATVAPVTPAATPQVPTRAATAKVLPQTDETNPLKVTLIGAALLAIVAIFKLVSIKRHVL
ncbi:LPXTG cell wall anchor domain-containing protein [Lactiplantibacillus carotarum]|uniref:LPXTG cell wall anchor domain-containing protein n=1 Tax=Lactiplantibacillus carotarum TaxID=2993456 RepID=UPI00298F30D7|nr:LPXTG cell wall anchor domain-containing protein [Lactiplantibacillus carotarum]